MSLINTLFLCHIIDRFSYVLLKKKRSAPSWLDSSVSRALYRCCRGRGSVQARIFQAFLLLLLKVAFVIAMISELNLFHSHSSNVCLELHFSFAINNYAALTWYVTFRVQKAHGYIGKRQGLSSLLVLCSCSQNCIDLSLILL